MAADDSRSTIKELKDAVNMTPKELERWAETDESKKVGLKEGESDDSTGHALGLGFIKI